MCYMVNRALPKRLSVSVLLRALAMIDTYKLV